MAAPAAEGGTEDLDRAAGIRAGSAANLAERVEVETGPTRGEPSASNGPPAGSVMASSPEGKRPGSAAAAFAAAAAADDHGDDAAAAAAAAVARYTRSAQRSSTRIAIRLSELPASHANSRTARDRRRRSRSGGGSSVEDRPNSAAGGLHAGRSGRSTRQHAAKTPAGVAAAAAGSSKRTSRRLAGEKAAIDMKDASDILDKIVHASKRARARAGAEKPKTVKSKAGKKGKKGRAKQQRQQKKQQQQQAQEQQNQQQPRREDSKSDALPPAEGDTMCDPSADGAVGGGGGRNDGSEEAAVVAAAAAAAAAGATDNDMAGPKSDLVKGIASADSPSSSSPTHASSGPPVATNMATVVQPETSSSGENDTGVALLAPRSTFIIAEATQSEVIPVWTTGRTPEAEEQIPLSPEKYEESRGGDKVGVDQSRAAELHAEQGQGLLRQQRKDTEQEQGQVVAGGVCQDRAGASTAAVAAAYPSFAAAAAADADADAGSTAATTVSAATGGGELYGAEAEETHPAAKRLKGWQAFPEEELQSAPSSGEGKDANEMDSNLLSERPAMNRGDDGVNGSSSAPEDESSKESPTQPEPDSMRKEGSATEKQPPALGSSNRPKRKGSTIAPKGGNKLMAVDGSVTGGRELAAHGRPHRRAAASRESPPLVAAAAAAAAAAATASGAATSSGRSSSGVDTGVSENAGAGARRNAGVKRKAPDNNDPLVSREMEPAAKVLRSRGGGSTLAAPSVTHPPEADKPLNETDREVHSGRGGDGGGSRAGAVAKGSSSSNLNGCASNSSRNDNEPRSHRGGGGSGVGGGGDGTSSTGVDERTSQSSNKSVVAKQNDKAGGGKAGGRSKAKVNKKGKKKLPSKSPGLTGGAELKFLKPDQAHAVPRTPTPRLYLPADQGGFAEDAPGAAAASPEKGAAAEGGAGGGTLFAPGSTEGGADVVWDSSRFHLLTGAKPASMSGGGGGGGCCGGGGGCGVGQGRAAETATAAVVGAAVEEPVTPRPSNPVSVSSAAAESVRSAPVAMSPSDACTDGKDAGKGPAGCPPPPQDKSPPGKSRKRSLKDEQDKIFDTLASKNHQKDLITPQEYGDVGGYFGEREQPFKVVVHPNVHFVADVHAYMMEKNEVIGWLGGWFDKENNVLYIQTAVPCREDQELSSGERGRTEVSMCQTSSFDTSQAIRGRKLQLVGWYHSHPKFVNDPSPIDVENHQLFQKDEKDAGSCGAWVGLIVGRKTSPSEFRWFRNAPVERVLRDETGEAIGTETVLCPMLLRTSLASSVESSAAAAAAAATAATTTATARATTEAGERHPKVPGAMGAGGAVASGGGGGGGEATADPLAQQQQQQQRQQAREAARQKLAAKGEERRKENEARSMMEVEAHNAPAAAAVTASSAASGAGGSSGCNGTTQLGAPIPQAISVAPAATAAAAVYPDQPRDGAGLFGPPPPPQEAAVNSGGEALSGGTISASALEMIVAIARNPPLVMSEEALEVLKTHQRNGSEAEAERGTGGYRPKLERVVEALTSLGRYYSGMSGRAPLSNGAKAGVPILEKLARSLARTVQHMELHPSEADEFIQDACSFLLACFRETDVRIANQQRGITKKRKGWGGAGSGSSAAMPRRSTRT